MNFVNYGNPLASLDALEVIGASMAEQQNSNADFLWKAETDAIKEQHSSPLSLLIGNIPDFTKFITKNIINYFQEALIRVLEFPAYLFIFPGILLIFSKINRIQLSYYIFAALGFLINCMTVFVPRYYIYVLASLQLPIVLFLFYQNYNENKSFQKTLLTLNKIFLGIIIIFLLKTSFLLTRANISSEPFYLKNAAKVFKAHSADSDIVIARKPHLAFLSDRKVEMFPIVESLDQLIKHAKKKNAQFIFYGEIESEVRPEMKILQKPEEVGKYLKLIYTQLQPEIYLYKIK